MLAERGLTRAGRPIFRALSRLYSSSDDEPELTTQRADSAEKPPQRGRQKGGLSFFEGGSGYGGIRRRRAKADPLNVSDAEVPWVDDWYRTRQGFARIQLLSKKTNLSVDQVQSRIAQLLSMAPGLQKFMPLLHPALFSTILANLSYSFEIMTMLKSELPAIDLGIVVSAFPRVLTWDKKLLYKCMCFLVVHFKGRYGAAEALNAYPMRLKFTRQLIDVLFTDHEKEAESETQRHAMGRLYQFNRHRKQTDPPQNTLVYFERRPPLRE